MAYAEIPSALPSNLLWDPIVSIEYVGREQVYDIEVAGTHNFIGNGIFAHNTAVLQPSLLAPRSGAKQPPSSEIASAASGGLAMTKPARAEVRRLRMRFGIKTLLLGIALTAFFLSVTRFFLQDYVHNKLTSPWAIGNNVRDNLKAPLLRPLLVQELASLLADPNPKVRRENILRAFGDLIELGGLKDPEVDQLFFNLTRKDPDLDVRIAVIERLGRNLKTRPDYIDPLIDLLTDPEVLEDPAHLGHFTLQAVLNAKGTEAEPKLIEAARNLLDSPEWRRQELGVWIAGSLPTHNPREATFLLTQASKSPAEVVRGDAVRALTEIARESADAEIKKTAVAVIVNALMDSSPWIRIDAAQELLGVTVTWNEEITLRTPLAETPELFEAAKKTFRETAEELADAPLFPALEFKGALPQIEKLEFVPSPPSEAPQRAEVRSKDSVVEEWGKFIQNSMDNAQRSRSSPWVQLKEPLRNLAIQNDFSQLPPEFKTPRLPFQELEQLETIGEGLRKSWSELGWEERLGHPNQYLVVLNPEDQTPSFYESNENRIANLVGGTLKDRLLAWWTSGVALVFHLRGAGFHFDYDGPGRQGGNARAYDSEFLVKAARRFIPLVLAWPEENQNQLAPATPGYPEKGPRFTYRDLILWGLTAMLDPRIHNPLIQSDRTINRYDSRPEIWPGAAQQLIPHFLLQMLTDLDEVDSEGRGTGRKVAREKVESLLAEVLSTTDEEWNQKGFRSPRQGAGFFLSMAYRVDSFLQAMETVVNSEPSRPLVDPAFMMALPLRNTGTVYTDSVRRSVELTEQRGYGQKYRDPEAFAREVFLEWLEFREAFPNLGRLVGEASLKKSTPRAEVRSVEAFREEMGRFQTEVGTTRKAPDGVPLASRQQLTPWLKTQSSRSPLSEQIVSYDDLMRKISTGQRNSDGLLEFRNDLAPEEIDEGIRTLDRAIEEFETPDYAPFLTGFDNALLDRARSYRLGLGLLKDHRPDSKGALIRLRPPSIEIVRVTPRRDPVTKKPVIIIEGTFRVIEKPGDGALVPVEATTLGKILAELSQNAVVLSAVLNGQEIGFGHVLQPGNEVTLKLLPRPEQDAQRYRALIPVGPGAVDVLRVYISEILVVRQVFELALIRSLHQEDPSSIVIEATFRVLKTEYEGRKTTVADLVSEVYHPNLVFDSVKAGTEEKKLSDTLPEGTEIHLQFRAEREPLTDTPFTLLPGVLYGPEDQAEFPYVGLQTPGPLSTFRAEVRGEEYATLENFLHKVENREALVEAIGWAKDKYMGSSQARSQAKLDIQEAAGSLEGLAGYFNDGENDLGQDLQSGLQQMIAGLEGQVGLSTLKSVLAALKSAFPGDKEVFKKGQILQTFLDLRDRQVTRRSEVRDQLLTSKEDLEKILKGAREVKQVRLPGMEVVTGRFAPPTVPAVMLPVGEFGFIPPPILAQLQGVVENPRAEVRVITDVARDLMNIQYVYNRPDVARILLQVIGEAKQIRVSPLERLTAALTAPEALSANTRAGALFAKLMKGLQQPAARVHLFEKLPEDEAALWDIIWPAILMNVSFEIILAPGAVATEADRAKLARIRLELQNLTPAGRVEILAPLNDLEFNEALAKMSRRLAKRVADSGVVVPDDFRSRIAVSVSEDYLNESRLGEALETGVQVVLYARDVNDSAALGAGSLLSTALVLEKLPPEVERGMKIPRREGYFRVTRNVLTDYLTAVGNALTNLREALSALRAAA